MENQKRISPKVHTFFDWLYKLLIMNVFTILFCALIFTAFPAIIAMHATIKNDMNKPGIFKIYFANFKKYFLKSFLIGLILLLIIGIVSYAFYFYSYAIPQDKVNKIIFQMGIAIMILFAIVILMLMVHIPLITITFESFSIGEILKTSFYVAIRYFLTTIILFGMLVLEIVGVIALPIWMLFGISLPVLLGIKFTSTIYKKFAEIDLEKIIHQVKEEEE